MSTTEGPRKAILFLGATGGVALAALRRSLAAGHTCIALCRDPSRLTALLAGGPESSAKGTTADSKSTAPPPNLILLQGNAHSASTLAAHGLRHPADRARLVDAIVFSLGARPTLRGMTDPHVCEKGMRALLGALATCRAELGAHGPDDGHGSQRGPGPGPGPGPGAGRGPQRPRLIAVSSTGLTLNRAGRRDMPCALIPLYGTLLGTAHADKRAMEQLVLEAGESVAWTVVRPSLFTNGPATEGKVRVGMVDLENEVARDGAPAVPVGWTISREDVGKWVFEECIAKEGGEWVGKAAVLTY